MPSSSAQPLVSVVVPAFNEEATLATVVEQLHRCPLRMEIVIVDDGSHDRTPQVIERLAQRPEVTGVFHDVNRGKGAAVRTGFLRARGDIVVVQDADLEYDPAELPRVVAPIVAGRADVVYGSRLRRGIPPGMHPLYFAGNIVLSMLGSAVTGLATSDIETCYKAVRRDVLQRVAPLLSQRGFGVELELSLLLGRIRGLRFAEVPIRYTPRSREEGKKIHWHDGLQALWCLLKC